MRVAPSVKPRCDGCFITKREGVIQVRCKKNPRHKARQG